MTTPIPESIPNPIQILPSPQASRVPFEWGELTWFASGPLGNSEGLTLGQCVIRPGHGNPRHYHPNCEEVLTVLQGTIHHTSPDGTPVEMNEGDTVTIPANVWHQATNIGTIDARLLIAFSSAYRETVGE